ncbi:MAG: hypothetical protein AAF564_18380 [Bacteroidota bacterium]
MNETALMREGTKVAAILRENGHVKDAEALELELAVQSNLKLQLEAAERIETMCHIKSLGDKNIKTMAWTAWLGNLGRLRRATSQTIKKLSREIAGA